MTITELISLHLLWIFCCTERVLLNRVWRERCLCRLYSGLFFLMRVVPSYFQLLSLAIKNTKPFGVLSREHDMHVYLHTSAKVISS